MKEFAQVVTTLGYGRHDQDRRPQSVGIPAGDGAVRKVRTPLGQSGCHPRVSVFELPISTSVGYCRRCAFRHSCFIAEPICGSRSSWRQGLAAAIPGAKYIEYPDGDHAFWSGDAEPLLGDIEEFITGHRESSTGDLERVLATVLFTDIVNSTRRAAELGDQKWRRLLDTHDQLAKQMVERHRGTLVKTTGDGVLATFDGPGRAVRCALAFGTAAGQMGIPLRAGLHTGEIELRGPDIGGISVHAAARVMAQSQPGEVLVSRVITDLVSGAGLRFAERGSHELKGLPGRWDLFAASL